MLAIGLLVSLFASPPQPAPNLRVPPGFVVTEFADSSLANDILSMTVDPRGRIVVAGKGYIRILVDDDGDGRADRAIPFADSPRDGAQGMFWEKESLFVSGDGGLRRFHVSQDGNHALGTSELIRAARTGGEHESHAIKRGPDGWLYWLLGNSAGVRAPFAQLDTSPIRTPVAGCLVRFAPDLKSTEIVADGFRNAYDFDFNPDGELFTFDSDNERCVSLPWYEGTRFYHVIPGGHYGWLNPQRAETWRLPPYACDVIPPVLDLGRGSPTAVVCYRGRQFPKRYQAGFFLFDWTFGRVYFLTLQRAGSSYRADKEIFLESTGDNGFAPTSALVHPATGELYVAIGGRGTRGGVYRVQYVGKDKDSTTSRAPLLPRTPIKDLNTPPSVYDLLLSLRDSPPKALHSLMRLVRFRHDLSSDDIRDAVLVTWNSNDSLIRQASASLLSSLDPRALASLGERVQTDHERACLVLAAIERAPELAEKEAIRLLKTGQTTEMRLVGVRALQLLLGGQGSRSLEGTAWEGYSARLPWWIDRTTLQTSLKRLPRLFRLLGWDLSPKRTDDIDREIDLVRLASRFDPSTYAALREAFPSGDAILDREITRTLAMVGDDDSALLERISHFWSTESDPASDIHYLLVFARLRASRTAPQTKVVAHALLLLDQKLTSRKWNRERNWYLRVSELYKELARRDPHLHDGLLNDPAFGRPDHALFAQTAGFPKVDAARRFLARAARNNGFEWNADLVALLAELPPQESFPLLRKIWKVGGLQDAVLAVLAQRPAEADRDKFLEGLASPQIATVKLCLGALEKLAPEKSGAALLPVVQGLGRLPDDKAANALREQFARDLAHWTGKTGLGPDKEAWRRWFSASFPELANRLLVTGGVDRAAWDKRLAGLSWVSGDADRGRAIFQQASCASCHSGGQAMGPDLRGSTNRFSRDDLFTAILQPSRDISPRYRTIQIITSDDKIYQGLIIYEAVDSLLLQVGPATTVRIVNQQIVSKRTTDISLMPVGLLDKASDRDIVDLYAYLKSLKP